MLQPIRPLAEIMPGSIGTQMAPITRAGPPAITVVPCSALLDALFGEAWYKPGGPSYDEQSELVRAWCDLHDSHYYAADREDFSLWRAVQEARAKGKLCVVTEDLS